MLDEHGEPVKGFEAEACEPIAADTLAVDDEDAGWVRWKEKQNVGSLQGQKIQLRFTLQNARLYSFRVADEKTLKLPVPRATTR